MNDRAAMREKLADEGITAETFRTGAHQRMRLVPEAREAVQRLSRRSGRSGLLSPLAYNLSISHVHRFIWFRVAKVGTRALFSHFANQHVALDVEHAMRIRYPTALFEGYFKFASVRHPLGRFVSAWRNKVVNDNYFGFDDATRARMQDIASFAQWTAEQDLGDLSVADHHLALQSRLIDLTQIDFVGRLENFDDDFAAVCRHVGIPVGRLEARNRTSQGPTAAQLVSPEVRTLVEEMYRRDFQIFGY